MERAPWRRTAKGEGPGQRRRWGGALPGGGPPQGSAGEELSPLQIAAAAATNYNKLPALKQHDINTSWSGGQRSDTGLAGLRSGCGQGWLLPEAPGENGFRPFPDSRSHRHPWLEAQPSSAQPSVRHQAPLPSVLPLPLFPALTLLL